MVKQFESHKTPNPPGISPERLRTASMPHEGNFAVTEQEQRNNETKPTLTPLLVPFIQKLIVTSNSNEPKAQLSKKLLKDSFATNAENDPSNSGVANSRVIYDMNAEKIIGVQIELNGVTLQIAPDKISLLESNGKMSVLANQTRIPPEFNGPLEAVQEYIKTVGEEAHTLSPRDVLLELGSTLSMIKEMGTNKYRLKNSESASV